jgi:hypothetical protein
MPEQPLQRIASRQMYPKPTTALHHLGADLQQLTANRADLSVLQLGPVKVLFQRLQENLSRRMQQQAELVGDKTMTTQTITLEVVL